MCTFNHPISQDFRSDWAEEMPDRITPVPAEEKSTEDQTEKALDYLRHLHV